MPVDPTGRPDGDELVTLRRDGAVAVVTLNRPTKLNAISSALEAALGAALSHPDLTSSGAVVLTGGPRVFSAGADVTEMREIDAASAFEYYRQTGGVYEAVAALPQPTVSAIAGYCLGGGLELALATDFRVAEETSVFGFPELDIGIIPSSGGTHRLVRVAGPAVARTLIVLRRRISAAEAERHGLVTELVPEGTALERALELARELADLPGLATTLAIRAIDAAAESSRDVGLLVEQLVYATLVGGEESRRRTGAFGRAGEEGSR